MKYKVISAYNVGSGNVLDKNNTPIPVSQLAPKVGDTVEGEIKSHFVFNKSIIGLELQVGVRGGSAAQVSKIIIPASSLVASNLSSSTQGASAMPTFNIYTVGGAMVGFGIGFGAYKMSKKSSIKLLVAYCAIGGLLGMTVGNVTSKIVK